MLLAVETSCDETAAAVVSRDLRVLSNVVASQTDLHEKYGGVVPEVASRAHVTKIVPVIDEALERAGVTFADLSAIAVTTHPGLVGSLLVGVTAAKSLAAVLDLPLVAVDHIQAHVYACRMAAGRDVFPAIGFVVSGGHTNLYDCRSATDLELVGSTMDDAVGEAFDKVAAVLGLPYPGGPSVQKAAERGDPKSVRFPRSLLKDERLDFSFSGLKTAVLYAARGTPGSTKPVPELTDQRIADLAAAFQAAAVDVLAGKCEQALERYGRDTLCVGGGVAANGPLRERLESMCEKNAVTLHLAPLSLCTDNAAMAGIAWELLDAGQVSPLDVDVRPGLVRR